MAETEPIVFGNEFSCEFSPEFCDIGRVSPKKIKVVTNKYRANNNQLSELQSKLDIISHITPVTPPISGVLSVVINEKSNNRFVAFQNQLNRIRHLTTPMMMAALPPTNNTLVVKITEKSNNKLSQLQSQLDRLHHIIPVEEDGALCQCSQQCRS